MRKLDAIAACLVLAALIAGTRHLTRPPEEATGPARAVDGDSLRLGGREIRLAGIDAPELHQLCSADGESYACGQAAKAELERLIAAGPVTCRISGTDRYRRALARCDSGHGDFGAGLVGRGFAVAYGAYEAEQEEARRRKLGLWRGAFEMPSEWRKAHPSPRSLRNASAGG